MVLPAFSFGQGTPLAPSPHCTRAEAHLPPRAPELDRGGSPHSRPLPTALAQPHGGRPRSRGLRSSWASSFWVWGWRPGGGSREGSHRQAPAPPASGVGAAGVRKGRSWPGWWPRGTEGLPASVETGLGAQTVISALVFPIPGNQGGGGGGQGPSLRGGKASGRQPEPPNSSGS